MGIAHQDDIEWSVTQKGEAFFRRKQLSGSAGGEDIGCSLYELPAGNKSWPFHYHTGNEEALYVLSGKGKLRLGQESTEIHEGNYVALPSRADHAHRIINDSNSVLRYLAISTMNDPDVIVYPDSDKIGVFTGSAPGDHENRDITKYFPSESDVSYWKGEENTS